MCCHQASRRASRSRFARSSWSVAYAARTCQGRSRMEGQLRCVPVGAHGAGRRRTASAVSELVTRTRPSTSMWISRAQSRHGTRMLRRPALPGEPTKGKPVVRATVSPSTHGAPATVRAHTAAAPRRTLSGRLNCRKRSGFSSTSVSVTDPVATTGQRRRRGRRRRRPDNDDDDDRTKTMRRATTTTTGQRR